MKVFRRGALDRLAMYTESSSNILDDSISSHSSRAELSSTVKLKVEKPASMQRRSMHKAAVVSAEGRLIYSEPKAVSLL